MIKSFRAQLTLWNVLVIAISLTLFAIATIYANELQMRRDIDRELVDRARRAPPEGPENRDAKPQDERNAKSNIDFADIRRPRRFDKRGQRIGPVQTGPFDAKALAEALKGKSLFTNRNYHREAIRIYTCPDQAGGAIQVAVETRDLDLIWHVQSLNLLWLLPVALGVSALGAYFLTKRATIPLQSLRQAANTITDEDLTRRLDIRGNDEFADLGITFNHMISRLERSFNHVRVAYENQKRFNADISHELRTPLTRIRLATTSALEPDSTDDEKLKALKVADESSLLMTRMIQKMLILAHADAGQLQIAKEPIDLKQTIESALDRLCPEGDRIIRRFCDCYPIVQGDRDYLLQIVSNLIENGLKFSPSDKPVTITLSTTEAEAVIEIHDQGPGVSREMLPQLGERFFRGDINRSHAKPGNGLGLAICKTLIEAHSGRLDFLSEEGEGFTAIAAFPMEPK